MQKQSPNDDHARGGPLFGRWQPRIFAGTGSLPGAFGTLVAMVVVAVAGYWVIRHFSGSDLRLAVPASVMAGEVMPVEAIIAKDWSCGLRIDYPGATEGPVGPSTWSEGARLWQVTVPPETPSGGADIEMTCTLDGATRTGSGALAIVARPE